MVKPPLLTAAQVLSRLRALGRPELAQLAQRYFKTGPGEYGDGDVFLGIRAAELRAMAKDFQQLPVRDVTKLLQDKIHEARTLALLILVRQFTVGDAAARKEIYRLYLKNTPYINNWDLVDCSAPGIVGAYLHPRSRRPLYKLARSKSLWEQRISIVATQYLIRENEFADTLAIAALLLGDKHDLIHKATGWMLREVGKRDQRVLEKFLRKHAAAMPRTMLRYAIERLPDAKRRLYMTIGEKRS